MDSGFPTLCLLRDGKDDWNTTIIATQAGITAHLPAKHSMFKSRCKKYCRSFSDTFRNEDLMVTYWNANNSVIFLDDDLESGPENWDFIETQDNRIKVLLDFIGQCMLGLIGQIKLVLTILQNIGQEENKIEF